VHQRAGASRDNAASAGQPRIERGKTRGKSFHRGAAPPTPHRRVGEQLFQLLFVGFEHDCAGDISSGMSKGSRRNVCRRRC
jgi:hypothetical protein